LALPGRPHAAPPGSTLSGEHPLLKTTGFTAVAQRRALFAARIGGNVF